MSKREYLRIVEENRDHSNITRSNKMDAEAAIDSQNAGVDNPG